MTLNEGIDDLRRRVAVWRRWLARYVLLPDLGGEGAQALRDTVREEGTLTPGYVLMCALSAGIATLGLLQSSPAVVIGAMLISPLMSPIASLGFGFASLDGRWIRQSARVVATGAAIGIATGMLLTWLSPVDNPTPEIIARTQPTLLDLAIALLSGIAGGYATVNQRGGTAIGVAIATALMPPLATIGYGLGAARIDFAGGAFLLFLTNLAAIAFSFAVIARLSGAARPIVNVELTPQHVAVGIAAFLALATPLAWTLNRIVAEADARSAARTILKTELGIGDTGIAQLDVHRSLLGELAIDAVVIAPKFRADAQSVVQQKLRERLGRRPNLNLQQVVAADFDSRARAIVDAAMARTAAGIGRDVAPIEEIRAALRVPAQSVWTNRVKRTVDVVPFAAPGWTVADYQAAEAVAAQRAGGWNVHVAPPLAELAIAFEAGSLQPSAEGDKALGVAVWALKRWGVTQVALDYRSDSGSADLGSDRVGLVADRLRLMGFQVVTPEPTGPGAAPGRESEAPEVPAAPAMAGTVIVRPLFPPPAARAQVER